MGSARSATALALLITATLASGCAGLLPDPPPSLRNFDFGPLPAHAATPMPARPVRLLEVTAPVWLESRDIHYRRLDEQPAALNAYARSQWIAPPSDLLAHRLHHLLAERRAEANRAEALLRIELTSFEQIFEAPDRALVRVRAVATLDTGERPRLRRVFSIERDSPPDVHGATRELPAAADALIEEIAQWLAAMDDGPAREGTREEAL